VKFIELRACHGNIKTIERADWQDTNVVAGSPRRVVIVELLGGRLHLGVDEVPERIWKVDLVYIFEDVGLLCWHVISFYNSSTNVHLFENWVGERNFAPELSGLNDRIQIPKHVYHLWIDKAQFVWLQQFIQVWV
jgi:hypothetical protein